MMDQDSSSSSGGFRLFDQLELHEFQDKFMIKSMECPTHGFSIDRRDGSIDPDISDSFSMVPRKTSAIYGVAGTIRLLAGTYVLVITSHKEVGTYLGFPVFRVMSMTFLSCNDGLRLSTRQEKKDEEYFLNLLKIVESTPGLYYSYRTDITLNLQRRSKMTEGWASKPLWKQADPRFVWNRNLLEELIEYKLDGFILPLLQGNILKLSFVVSPILLLPHTSLYVCLHLYLMHNPITQLPIVFSFNQGLSLQIGKFTMKESPVHITLISRRCTRRLGTRMWRRGANLQGDTANFIETEQLLEHEGLRSSFLQIRGSIPLLWEQIVDLSYKPRLKIINHVETPKVIERHFFDLLQRYGDIVAVDLTDKHGDEGELSKAYAAEMQNLQDFRYISFDFHGCCGNSNFDSLQLLYDQISEDLEMQGYFFIDARGNIQKEQTGIIRFNCIDCLDRTNVTQSYLARECLNSQLQRIGILSPTESISNFGEVCETFRTLWAEQGDEISLEYSGTHALKGDLVRYGKQTVAGLIKDGMSAVTRYYINNFQDGIKQDAIDLISGRYIVNRNNPSPFQLNGFESLAYLPAASALLIGGFTATSLTISHDQLRWFSIAGRNAQHFVSSVLWAGVTAGVMAVVKANGRQFCSRPRLCRLL